MATVKHPTTGDLLTVPDADLADWLEQGWVDTAPKPDAKSDDKAGEPEKARPRKTPSRDDVR